MPNAKVTVVATIKAQPGKEAQVRQELLALVPPTRAEDGCINYDLHQSPDNPTLFLFYENWSSKEALDRHSQSPHLRALGAKAAELFAAPPEIVLWEMISE